MKTREDILNQIKELEEQLKQIDKSERSIYFVELLRNVLLIDKCTIILQGHEEWQFQERFSVGDISNDVRYMIDNLLVKIIKLVGKQ